MANELSLREYQSNLLDSIREAWESDPRVMAWLPTGGGKTELSVQLAREEEERKGVTLFVVERKTLAKQAAARFQKYGMLVGILRGEDTHVRGYEPVIVASIQTIASRKDHGIVADVLARVTLIVVDEAHIRFKDHTALEQACPDSRILGLSATPLRDGLGNHFDTLVRGPSYDWMIEHRHLVRPRYFLPDLGAVSKGLSSVAVSSTGDFAQSPLAQLMRDKAIIGDVVTTWKEKAEDRQTIVFCVDIAHSKDVCDSFLLAGVTAEHIDQRTKEDERTGMFERFRAGQTRVLCSINVLSLGFDQPIASCAVLARPTLSLSMHVQQVGRVMRPYPDKVDCIVLDHAGNVMRHSKVETFCPPELSDLDRNSDKKKRTADQNDYFPCPECRAVMPPGQRVCVECGHEIHPKNGVHFVPGDLREESAPVVSDREQKMRIMYAELRHYAKQRGYKDGWAYFKMVEEMKFKPPFAWKHDEPKNPSTGTLNYIKSWNIAFRKRKNKTAARVANNWRTQPVQVLVRDTSKGGLW